MTQEEKIKELIAKRKAWLAKNSIQDWNDTDTIFIAHEFSKWVIITNKTKTNDKYISVNRYTLDD